MKADRTINQIDLSLNVITRCQRKWERLSVPREGFSISMATEARAVHVRKAVSFLADGFDDSNLLQIFDALFAPRWELAFEKHQNDMQNLKIRAAWNLICIWFLARGNNAIRPQSSFQESEEWFTGSINVPAPPLSSLIRSDSTKAAHQEISKITIDQDFWDLFPYILEEHGPGSRASVLRDPTTKKARAAKKRDGVYYTPSDVADYMTEQVLANYSGNVSRALCFDPACGTGVFLLSLCRAAEKFTNTIPLDRFEFIINNLYGCDIDTHAVEASAFVLLHHCISDVNKNKLAPWAAWHAIRLNISCFDSLNLAAVRPNNNIYRGHQLSLREEMKKSLIAKEAVWVTPEKVFLENNDSSYASHSLFSDRRMVHISELFAETEKGFNILVGNPPYSVLGERTDYSLLVSEYSSFDSGKVSYRDNAFLLFVEMMWRLTMHGQSSSALVTPLSISYNNGDQYKNCRHEMSRRGGKWQFAFFDREPHALFGEDVKTRNAILFRTESNSTPHRGEASLIETGPLRKWTSRTRKHLFESIRFTSLGFFDITSGIPKIDGSLQTKMFFDIYSRSHNTPSLSFRVGTCKLENAFKQNGSNCVYVGGTAYNFLNVFRGLFLDTPVEYPLSESPVHRLEFRSDSEADFAFAILSSRIVFWLWHVQADGFHVPGWFIRSLPFHHELFTDDQCQQLIELGELLWKKVQRHRFISINGGKLTFTFRSLSCNEERDAIDGVLIDALGLSHKATRELKDFVRRIVVVDESDLKRQHLQNYFDKE